MPAFHEMDMVAFVEREQRINRLLCDPANVEEIRRFEDWAADRDATRTFLDPDGDGFSVQNIRDPGDVWITGRDMADLMIAHYDLPVGLYEKLLSAARQAGLRRRLAEKRVRRLSIAELKAQAEW